MVKKRAGGGLLSSLIEGAVRGVVQSDLGDALTEKVKNFDPNNVKMPRRGSRNGATELDKAYEVLQLSPNASREVIDASFKILAKQRHPDKPTGSDVLMSELNWAYGEVINAITGG